MRLKLHETEVYLPCSPLHTQSSNSGWHVIVSDGWVDIWTSYNLKRLEKGPRELL